MPSDRIWSRSCSARSQSPPLRHAVMAALKTTPSGSTCLASISSSSVRPRLHSPARAYALIMTAYVTVLRGAPATSMYAKSVCALSIWSPSAHALMAFV
eukprot:scaffold60809_cov67-Phaeocystis_antarctica.AAC.3